VPGLAAVGAFGVDVAILVALKAVFDTGAAALVESVAKGVLDVVGGIVKAVFDFLVIVLFRAHAAAALWKGTAESAVLVAMFEVRFGADLMWVVVVGVEMMVLCTGAKRVGTRVEARHGDWALVALEEGEKVAGFIPVDGDVLTDFCLVGDKTS
jgi:hypothetical protein